MSNHLTHVEFVSPNTGRRLRVPEGGSRTPIKRAPTPGKKIAGFFVMAHRPGEMLAAKKAALAEFDRYLRLSDTDKTHTKAPEAWNEQLWRRTARFSKIYKRPFSNEESAN